jgi:PEP-CTERM motif
MRPNGNSLALRCRRREVRVGGIMNRLIFRSLITAFILVVTFGVPSIASADGITWTLSGVTFDDGGTASGSFVFDALTNTYSAIDIITTAGSQFGGATYTGIDPGFPSTSGQLILVTNALLSDFTGTGVLELDFGPLTNLGGTFPVVGTGEGTCDNAGCSSGTELRTLTAGEVTGVVATPEPSTLLLLVMGLAGLAGAAAAKRTVSLT